MLIKNLRRQFSINLNSNLSPNEFISIIDSNDVETGEIVTRAEMRKHNLWHRSTSIFVINQFQEICVNKRSMSKDYYPGWLDLSFGGVVTSDEMKNPDLSARREASEELGIPDIHKIKLPGSTSTLDPKFVFKHKFENEFGCSWMYIYYLTWHSDLENQGIFIKPQSSEISSIHWQTPESIRQRIS